MRSVVYLARLDDGAAEAAQAGAARKVIEASDFAKNLDKLDMVAIKVHVGEKNNVTHLRPGIVAAAVGLIKDAGAQAFITDTSTLYRGQRENAIKHTLHAHTHGFSIESTGAPFIPVDGLSGTHEREVEINGELEKTVKVAGQLHLADALLVISHATGHMGTGIGAAIKNVGMGLASRAGKMRQHSSISPEVEPEKCENCGKCRKWCPEDAIDEREGASYIQLDKCIGCGECIAVCRYGAVKFNYAAESVTLQKSMAEHAAGAIKRFGEKALYVNVLVDMTQDCDCWDRKQEKIAADVGIIASADIVACDRATLDLTAEAHGDNLSKTAYPKLDPGVQIEHAEKMGLGERRYRLVEV
jgi:uncharacterized Fe-S center protein